ncbi:MAG: Coenzyme F420 hydrogenase/dehydrogenase, beta subunit C-terminal domain [Smithella sp.]
MKLQNAHQVSEWRLCVGCGACAYACPEQNITLINIVNSGIRPTYNHTRCKECGDCIKVCPGYETTKTCPGKQPGFINELKASWGTILEVWEGYATDPDIRFNGSSGGLASALALYCLEKEGMYGVLHTAADNRNLLANRTVLSRNRDDILSRMGSRYSPSSPCSALKLIESAPESCVFIGKPCDVAGLRKAMFLRQELDKKVGVVIGIFCAGTPSTQGTIDLLNKLHINADDVSALRYRGKGWPGLFSVQHKKDTNRNVSLTYKEAWGFIQAYRPYRCYLCPDATSELADISCGDSWYREVREDDLGYSLVLVRTERGRQILHGAIEAGYVTLERAAPKVLSLSQRDMPLKRGAVWGRLLTMRACGIPVPKFVGFSLFRNWLAIPAMEKARSVADTIKRIIKRKYYRKLIINANNGK